MPDDSPADEDTAEELVEAINESDADFTSSPEFDAAERLADDLNDIFEPILEIQRQQAQALLEPIREIQRQQAKGFAESFREISRMQAEMMFDDLPDEVFSTALAASTVSTRARTRTSPTPSPSSTDSVETPVDQTHEGIDVDAPDSLYVNTAFAFGSVLAYQFEGLTPKQRQAAAFFIGGSIAFGFAVMTPYPWSPTALGGTVGTGAAWAEGARNPGDENDQ